MDISFDPEKRRLTLEYRGFDFADAATVFEGLTITVPDDRYEYGEDRFVTAGFLVGRCVVLVWTPREASRRIISMRYAHAAERRRWFDLE